MEHSDLDAIADWAWILDASLSVEAQAKVNNCPTQLWQLRFSGAREGGMKKEGDTILDEVGRRVCFLGLSTPV